MPGSDRILPTEPPDKRGNNILRGKYCTCTYDETIIDNINNDSQIDTTRKDIITHSH